MKVSPQSADRFCDAPDPAARAFLFYGDPGLVRERRDRLTARLAAQAGELDIARVEAETARRDPAALDDALRARSFFGGARCVVIDGAGDGLAKPLAAAFDALDGAAFLVATAGSLKAGTGLRKLFESRKIAAAVPCHAAAPEESEIRAFLAARGVAEITPEAAAALRDFAAGLDRGVLWRALEVVALYKGEEPGPLTEAAWRAAGPADFTSTLDVALDATAEGRPEAVRRALARVAAQGVSADAAASAALRRFRTLAAAAAIRARERCDGESALGKLRPPVRFPLSKPLARQLERWDAAALEAAVAALAEAQAEIRGGGTAPHFATLERRLIRVALSARR